MRIALDAMGTDDAPASEVAGALAAVERDPDLELVLVGDEVLVADALGMRRPPERVSVVHAPERIVAANAPIAALNRAPLSSIRVGMELVRGGRAAGFVSAGCTGAVLAASVRMLGCLPGVRRPSVAAPIPTARGSTLVVDAGANIDCKAAHLLQFGRLGSTYLRAMGEVERPRVGLLNVGAEEGKGTRVLRQAYRLLAGSGLNFVGNVEGRDIIGGACDVLVCDGFSGNVLLKFYESVGGFLVDSLRSRIGSGDLLDDTVSDLFRVFDYTEKGGVPLLGVNGVSIMCHGESSPKAITGAVRAATRTIASGMVAQTARHFSRPRAAAR